MSAILTIIHAAGWPIYLLLIASITATTIIIERCLSLRQPLISPSDLLDKATLEYKQHGAPKELLLRLEKHSPLGQVLAAGLKHVNSPREVMKDALDESGQVVAHQLERFLTTLGSIAAMAPLLGLLGTVIGMIELFAAQNPAGGSNPQALAHGISVALYNTAFGIIVAIPSMMFYRHFRAKIDSLLVDMQQKALKLVEIVHGDRAA